MPDLVIDRERFVSRTYKEITNKIYTKLGELDVSAWRTEEPVSFDERTSGAEMHLKIGDRWGSVFDCAWFNFVGIVPKDAKGKCVVLRLDVSGEMCIYKNGIPDEGMTTQKSDDGDESSGWVKVYYPVAKNAKGGEVIDIWADAGCNDLFGNYVNSGILADASIYTCNQKLKALMCDMKLLLQFYESSDKNTARSAKVFQALVDACACMKNFSDKEISKARGILAVELNRKNGDSPLSVTAAGHSHLDLAWLWPIRETKRKGLRTFATALRYMERYPDYHFVASQPQLYEWIKNDSPELYKQVKARIKEGKWEAEGAMWVEPDTNVTGGESLVRQILYGKRFFKKEFGKDVITLFLPDVFGYSAALPQILAKSGIPYFMTQKLSWNEHTVHPHHTFIWRGIDGTGVLAHMLPENCYNSAAEPQGLRTIEKNFIDKNICDEALMLYGAGDGGGGPAETHLEALDRTKNLFGLPPVKQGSVAEFFKRQEKVRKRLHEWQGELYLEKHQGTYTTQSKNKYYNQLMESKLRELELAYEELAVLSEFEYPKDKIDAIWKEVLLYQFHDILPGSSIDRVYKETDVRYKALSEEVQNMLDDAYLLLASKLDSCDREAFVVNTLNWNRSEWINSNGSWCYVSADSMGLFPLVPINKELNLKVGKSQIENANLRVKFAADGSVASVYDKINKREALSGKANKLNVYVDRGDCWDIGYYRETEPDLFELLSSDSYIDGVKAVMKNVYRYNNSTVTQYVSLTDSDDKVVFETQADWFETHKMLRTAFPVTAFSDHVTCGIQFGEINRTNTENTLANTAQFEICAQKWIDISQNDYGVSLLTDCKYGFRAKGNVLDINLLRSQTHPGKTSDKGHHEFKYALYPHKDNHISADTARKTKEFNNPLKAVAAGYGSIEAKPFVEIDKQNIIVEAVKKAEDSNKVILRLYESAGKSVSADIKLGFEYKKAEYVSMTEEGAIPADLNKVKFKPFEIITIAVTK